MAIERIGNTGYLSVGKQTDPSTPAATTIFIPLYDEDLTTDGHLQPQDPVTGQKFGTFNVLAGQRDHMGTATIIAEPNTLAVVHDAFLTKGTTTGPNPYTQPFTYSVLTNPNPYTYDISTGNIVKRFWGVGVSSISPDINDNEIRAKLKISALGSFEGREIASVATTTLTLSTSYDPVPNPEGWLSVT
jgi:hypothetical protein